MSPRSRLPLHRFLLRISQPSISSSSSTFRPILDFSVKPWRADDLHFPYLMSLNSRFVSLHCFRSYSGASGSSEPDFDQVREVDRINLKFAEAREEIESAMESKETVYFDEEAECARDAVKEVLELYEGLLAKLSDSERKALQRSMGLKIEQLKAELNQLDE
ncbi:uncharacterized protein LOC101219561 [Cucumis sativus]|uniref:Late embryogenesis abundant protein n=1 Tax=Cucumis sativus TaxID=3659 RepID=A0A0A0KEB4_CUCSA|nr:uncharacterized protein LOC101219561 [Cucumis sativus]KGN46106.1 hypothetical protein Csa_005419 [Cucumis sativus]